MSATLMIHDVVSITIKEKRITPKRGPLCMIDISIKLENGESFDITAFHNEAEKQFPDIFLEGHNA
jgi:hypothetical protein